MPETQTIEYKSSRRDEYLKWICGFANANGGTLFIGKDDDGKVVGVENAKQLMEEIPNKVRDILWIMVDVNLHHTKQGDFIEIVVEPHLNPVNYKGQYHYRRGRTKQDLKGWSRQIKAVEYVKERGKITNREYQELNDATPKTSFRDLDSMVEKWIFQKDWDNKSSYYILINVRYGGINGEKDLQSQYI